MYRVSMVFDQVVAIEIDGLDNESDVEDIGALVDGGTPVIIVDSLDDLENIGIDPSSVDVLKKE